ncbi:MAG TPA: diguanylate cyclase, partial [Lysobacter sp.]|nr:diguanylate cyclase [Lysobacter sp.]
DGAWPAGAWVLSIESAAFQRISLHVPGAPPRHAQLLDAGHGRPAFGRLAFDVARLPADGAPLRLHVDATDTVPSPMYFVLRDAAAQSRAEAGWLAFATACLATMLATAVIALFFGLRLRDAAFGYYAAYVVSYALIQATQSGYIVRPLGWDAMAATLPTWGRAVTTLSIVSAVLFLDRFAELRQRLPRLRCALHGYCALMLVLVCIGYMPGLQAPARALINPVLILGAPLVLGTAIAAVVRRSRFAAIFLLGWLPLLGVTVLGSLQLYGLAPDWTWIDDAALAVGAYEAIVLSLGLAERAASVRRQRDQARVLAGIDPLTGVLNRRAWREALEACLREPDAAGLSVLYLDLDHFKHVNDRLGHAGGDRVLQLFADVLRQAVRGDDVVGRYGGEEFVIGLVGGDARAVAERIRTGLHARSGEAGTPLTVSIGVAARHAGEGIDELLRRADAALYAAKHGGRDRVVAG